MPIPNRENYTFSPEAMDDVADQTEGTLALWFRQLADIQEVLNLVHDDGADGLGCHECSVNLRERLEPLLAGLEIIAIQADHEMYNFA